MSWSKFIAATLQPGVELTPANALNGNPMQLLDMDGTPPLPLEVDDEFLSPHLAADAAHQPPGRLSYMAGFIAISKLFKVLSGCIVRHRTLVNDPQSAQGHDTLRTYVDRSLEHVQVLLAAMPEQLQPGNAADGNTVFGTQAANVYITALCIELALVSGAPGIGETDWTGLTPARPPRKGLGRGRRDRTIRDCAARIPAARAHAARVPCVQWREYAWQSAPRDPRAAECDTGGSVGRGAVGLVEHGEQKGESLR